MRIPLEQTDLQHFLSRITPKLQAAWPVEQLPPGPFEDVVAKFLGYEDHFTLLDCVGEWSAFEDKPISRDGLKEAILWNGFAAGQLSYFKLLEIFPVDDLKYLAADRFTNEGRKEAQEEEQGSQGKYGYLFIQDEYSHYIGALFGSWIKETPELLDAGAPPYELVLLSDGRGFTFERLRKKFKLLPKDLDEKLVELPGYRKLTKDKRRLKFFKEHLIPEAFTGPLEAVSGYDRNQDGIQLLNMGGAYRLFNDPLGGMIPYKFQRDSDRIHQAKLMIMRGQPVHFEEGFSDPGDDGCRTEIAPAKLEDCKISSAARDLRLIDYMTGSDVHPYESLLPPEDTFVEYGQTYIRNNAWLNKSGVPAVLEDLVADFPDKPAQDTQESFPAWAKAFHEHLLARIDVRVKQAENAVVEAYSDGRLVKLAFALSQYSSVNLNDHAKAQMEVLGGVSSDFDPDSRLMEENHSQRNCQRVGDLIVVQLPQFTMFTPQTLGWLYYFNANQHPNSYRASHGEDELAADRVPSYLCSLIFALNQLAVGREVTRSAYPSMRDVMLCVEQLLIMVDATRAGRAITLVQAELLETMNIAEIYGEVSEFFKTLERQKQNVTTLNAFREKRAQLDALRAEGTYQYVHYPVSREDTGSLTSMFRSGRKVGGTIFATQTLADFGQSRNPLSKIAKTLLPGNKRTQKLRQSVAARPKKPSLAALGKSVISSIRQSLGQSHTYRPSSSRGR